MLYGVVIQRLQSYFVLPRLLLLLLLLLLLRLLRRLVLV